MTEDTYATHPHSPHPKRTPRNAPGGARCLSWRCKPTAKCACTFPSAIATGQMLCALLQVDFKSGSRLQQRQSTSTTSFRHGYASCSWCFSNPASQHPTSPKANVHLLTQTSRSAIVHQNGLLQGDRMWNFAIGIYLVGFEGSLILAAVLNFGSSGAILVLGGVLGNWVDNNTRLRGTEQQVCLLRCMLHGYSTKVGSSNRTSVFGFCPVQ